MRTGNSTRVDSVFSYIRAAMVCVGAGYWLVAVINAVAGLRSGHTSGPDWVARVVLSFGSLVLYVAAVLIVVAVVKWGAKRFMGLRPAR